MFPRMEWMEVSINMDGWIGWMDRWTDGCVDGYHGPNGAPAVQISHTFML